MEYNVKDCIFFDNNLLVKREDDTALLFLNMTPTGYKDENSIPISEDGEVTIEFKCDPINSAEVDEAAKDLSLKLAELTDRRN